MNETETTTNSNDQRDEQSQNFSLSKEIWIEEAIQREATPRELRKETQEEFCKRVGINPSTYYRNVMQKENKRKIVEIWLNEALNGGQEVLKALQEKAKAGDTKAIELYIKFVLELAENLDIKSGGNTIFVVAKEIAIKNGINISTPIPTDNS